jgi:hypothetical protein
MTTLQDPTINSVMAEDHSGASLGSVWTLARVEGSKVIRHPAFLAFLLLSMFSSLMIVGRESRVALFGIDYLAGLAFPVCAGTLIATNMAMLRARRHHTQELYEAAPMSMRARTGAHLLSSLWAAWTVTVVFVAWVVVMRVAFDATGLPQIGAFLLPGALTAGAGVVGVMVARWVPSALVSVPAVALIGFVEGFITGKPPSTSSVKWFAPWAPGDLNAYVWPRPHAWHLIYVVGLIGVLSATALLRDRDRRRVWIAFGMSVALAVSAGFVQTRTPSPGQIKHMLAMFNEPASVQRCVQREVATFCTFPGLELVLDAWQVPVAGVLRAVPSSARSRALVVAQRVDPGFWEQLPGRLKVRVRSLPLDPTGAGDGAVHTGMDSWDIDGPMGQLRLALETAQWATGMPIDPTRRVAGPDEVNPFGGYDDVVGRPAVGQPWESPCVARGQARAVVALWLAGQATPTTGNRLAYGIQSRDEHDDPDDGVDVLGDDANGFLPPGDTFVLIEAPDGRPSVLWTLSDIHYALQLLRRPAAQVTSVLQANWITLTSPDTTTSKLVSLFGLTPQLPAQTTMSSAAPDVHSFASCT